MTELDTARTVGERRHFPARPSGKPIDIHEAYRLTMERYPKTMEALRQSEMQDNLKRLYDATAEEPLPDDMKELLDRLG